MSQYKNLNGAGESKSSSEDVTSQMPIDDHSPNNFSKDNTAGVSGDQKSPTASGLSEDTAEKEDTASGLSEDTAEKEDTSSEFCAENSPEEKEKSCKSFAGISSDVSVGGVSRGISEKMSSSQILLIDETGRAPAADKLVKVAEEHQLDSSEKRKPRLNRRSFHLHNTFLADLDKPKSDNVVKGDNKKVGVSKRNIISLSSVKNTAAGNMPVAKEKKKIVLKRKQSSSFELEEKDVPSKTSDAPAKKKHKPITWP